MRAPLELDHADAADVHRREVLQVAERGRVDPQGGMRPGSSSRPARSTVWPSMTTSTVVGSGARRRRRAARRGGGRNQSGVVAHRDAPVAIGRASRRPTRWRSTPSGRARRSRRRASPGRSPRAGPSPRPRQPIGRPDRSRASELLLPHGADAAGHALAARLVAEERRDPRAGCRRGRSSRRRPGPRPSRASRRSRACPRRSAASSSLSGPDEHPGGAAEQHGAHRLRRREPRPPAR